MKKIIYAQSLIYTATAAISLFMPPYRGEGIKNKKSEIAALHSQSLVPLAMTGLDNVTHPRGIYPCTFVTCHLRGGGGD